MNASVRTAIVADSLAVEELRDRVSDERCGAVVVFAGTVSHHEGGKAVDYADYHAHPSATAVLQDLAEQAALRPGVHRIEIRHRVGPVGIGEASLVVVVGAEHPAQAFGAVRALVDEVKSRLPIWKRLNLADGGHLWSGID